MRIVALLATVVVLSASADIFKWVDERGETQYGDSPPRGAKATRIAVSPPGEKAVQGNAAKGKPQNENARVSKCTYYKEQLATVEAPGSAPGINEKGETAPLADLRRDEAKDKLRKLVKEHCS
jgi:hypothetical protein